MDTSKTAPTPKCWVVTRGVARPRSLNIYVHHGVTARVSLSCQRVAAELRWGFPNSHLCLSSNGVPGQGPKWLLIELGTGPSIIFERRTTHNGRALLQLKSASLVLPELNKATTNWSMRNKSPKSHWITVPTPSMISWHGISRGHPTES